MRPLLTLAIIAAAVVLMWSAGAVKITSRPAKPAATLVITDALFQAAVEGMPIANVEALWGSPKEKTEIHAQMASETKLLWVDSENRPCYAYFRDGKLHRKHR